MLTGGHVPTRYRAPATPSARLAGAVTSGILQRAVRQGILRDDLDLDLLLDLVLGVPAYRWLTTGKPVGAATTRTAIDLVWPGALRRD